MAEESYEFKYDTGKNMQRISGFVSILLILAMLILPSLTYSLQSLTNAAVDSIYYRFVGLT